MIRTVIGHPNYKITDKGFVYKMNGIGIAKELAINLSNGQPRVCIDGENYYLGKLVLEHFKPCENPLYKAFYIDGNKLNNDVSNLVWLSPSDVQLYSTYTIAYRKEVLGAWN